jgi:multimeric flavodoxin WrbA
LNDLNFRNCEGYYSKAAKACTWPCSVTSMDKTDQLDQVYEMAVHWADILLIATPIRWGAASSLYYKMVERMNCIQNQITINNKVLIRNKVAAFIITGGQDGIQAVAGQMMGFFSEIGYLLPQFPVHRALARLGVRGDGAQHGLRRGQRQPARGRARAGEAQCGSVEEPARTRDCLRDHRARRPQGVG